MRKKVNERGRRIKIAQEGHGHRLTVPGEIPAGKGYSLTLDSSVSAGQEQQCPSGRDTVRAHRKAVCLREAASVTKGFVKLPQREHTALHEARRAIEAWYCLFNGTLVPLNSDAKVFSAT